jgi:hypothetical protein
MELPPDLQAMPSLEYGAKRIQPIREIRQSEDHSSLAKMAQPVTQVALECAVLHLGTAIKCIRAYMDTGRTQAMAKLTVESLRLTRLELAIILGYVVQQVMLWQAPPLLNIQACTGTVITRPAGQRTEYAAKDTQVLRQIRHSVDRFLRVKKAQVAEFVWEYVELQSALVP